MAGDWNIKYRSLVCALLSAPSRSVTRDEATTLYSNLSRVCFQQLTLKYTPATEPLNFSVVMEEAYGRKRNMLVIDVHNNLLRMLLQQDFPDSFEVGVRQADEVARAFYEIIGKSSLPTLVECRLRAQMPVKGVAGQKALEGLKFAVMGAGASRLEALGPISLLGVRYEVGPAEEITGPLSAPCREVMLEPLREEPGFYYMEVMSNWGRQLLKPKKDGQLEVGDGPLALGVLEPSRYLNEVRGYIESHVGGFLGGA